MHWPSLTDYNESITSRSCDKHFWLYPHFCKPMKTKLSRMDSMNDFITSRSGEDEDDDDDDNDDVR